MTLLQNNSNYLETSILVLNEKSELIFSTVKLDQEKIREFSEAGGRSPNGWQIFKPQGQKDLMLIYANTSINGIQNWKIIETIPKSIILSKITFLRNLTLLLFAGLFAVSLWVIILLSRRVYSPIQELVHNVMEQHQAQQLDGQQEANELVYLSRVFSRRMKESLSWPNMDGIIRCWHGNGLYGNYWGNLRNPFRRSETSAGTSVLKFLRIIYLFPSSVLIISLILACVIRIKTNDSSASPWPISFKKLCRPMKFMEFRPWIWARTMLLYFSLWARGSLQLFLARSSARHRNS